MKEAIKTDTAPEPGDYSQGIKIDPRDCYVLYTCGQVANFPDKEGVDGETDIRQQTKRGLENIKGIVEAAGGELSDIVRVNVFMKDMPQNWDGFAEVYREYFPPEMENRPTRVPVGVAEIPWHKEPTMIMMDAIAYIPKERENRQG